MIRHVVIWQLLPEAAGQTKAQNAALAKKMLEALPAHIPDIRSISVGLNCPEIAGNHDLVLIVDFDDLAALQRYQDHPEHLKAGAFIGTIRSSRAAVDFAL